VPSLSCGNPSTNFTENWSVIDPNNKRPKQLINTKARPVMASRCKRRLASYGNQLLRRDFLRDPDPSFIMVLAHSPITSLATYRNHSNQMMPFTTAACFDNVRRELIRATMEFS
jgi:hypothetical protein